MDMATSPPCSPLPTSEHEGCHFLGPSGGNLESHLGTSLNELSALVSHTPHLSLTCSSSSVTIVTSLLQTYIESQELP